MFYRVETPRSIAVAQRVKGLPFLIVNALIACLIAVLVVTRAHAAPDEEAKSIEFWDDYEERSLININHDPWQALLNKYLDDKHPSGISRFNYAAVSPVDMQRLEDYLEYLQKMEPRQLNKDEQLAYWINLYNAKTVHLVVQSYINSEGITSIRQLRSGMFTPGPWERELFTVAQQDMTLDNIEHGILRPHWNDPRVHFVLNSAALGSPSLLKTAFNGENNEQLLAAAERDFLTHARAVRVDGGELVLSSIFEWHGTDFADSMPGLINYLKTRVPAELAPALDAASGPRFEHDWALNSPDSGS